MFLSDFYVWVERISKKWDRKQTIDTLKEVNKVRRLLEDKLSNGRKVI